MFTGIVTDVGEIAKIEKIKDTRAKIFCTYNVSEIDLGASICCDGVCLTVTDSGISENKNWFSVDISSETILKTIIGDKDFGWKPGRKVNLERSLRLGDELGGHIVTGHIDGTGSIEKILDVEGSTQVTFQTNRNLAKFIAEKLFNTTPVIYVVDGFEGVAVRFRQQINENSKMSLRHDCVCSTYEMPNACSSSTSSTDSKSQYAASTD